MPKYRGIYDIDPAFMTGDAIKWTSTGNGEFIIGVKGGKRYFIKRNMHIRYPDRSLPKPVYDKYMVDAKALEDKQQHLRIAMRGLSIAGDHIVAEEDNFWDESMFVTVTSCISDALPDDYDYTSLSFGEFLKLALQTTEAVGKLHDKGVIHGDLKPKNILVTEKDGVYTPYIIDFDSSYTTNAIPEWESIGGSDGYQAPEVIVYGDGEGSAPKKTITEKVDIFSLGVVFHKWWAGKFPGVDIERGSVGMAALNGKDIHIDKKFNVRIGDGCGATLQSLINWMFAKDSSERPTAKQVAGVLSDTLEVPEKFQIGSDIKPLKPELWEVHKTIAELLSVEKLKALGVRSLIRVNFGSGSAGIKYRVTLTGGEEEILTINELCDRGYAIVKGADIDKPWDEHMIEFEPADVIVKKGYSKIRRVNLAYRKRYIVTTISGMEIDKGYEWLIDEGLAHPRLVEVEADTPWPEHGTAYNYDNLARGGVIKISRVEVDGEHRYKVVYKDKVNERAYFNNLKLMGYIV